MLCQGLHAPSVNDGLLVMRADGEDLEEASRHQDQVLVSLLLEDLHQLGGSAPLEDQHLGGLVSHGQYPQAVRQNSQQLVVVTLQQRHHHLDAVGLADRGLGSLTRPLVLVQAQQQGVEGCYGVELYPEIKITRSA